MAPPRNNLPDVSGLVIAAQDDNREYSTADMSPGHADSTRGSDRTVLDPPQEYEYAGEDSRYEEPHRSAGFWEPSMKKIRGEVIFEWARMR